MKYLFIKKMFWLWVLVSLLKFNLAFASSLGVWPINPRIDAPASSALVWVKNNNKAEPVVLQARVFLWRQQDNSDQLIPQDDVVVSPPIIEVKADAQQIFRVMNRQGVIQNATEEKSYRLLIDEVPKEEKAQDSLLRFQMRYSLPLFVGLPESLAAKSMVDRLNQMASGLRYRIGQTPEPFLEINNNNFLHARLSKVAITNTQLPDKPLVISEGLLGYILPNSTRRWPLTAEQLSAIKRDSVITFEQEHQELRIAAEQ